MAALIPIILANLPAIFSLGQTGFNFVASLMRTAKQTGEWTAEHDAAFIAGVTAWMTDPAWQPDKKKP